MLNSPNYRSKRPAPRHASGPPRHITDDVTWTRIVEPRERYRIAYVDSSNVRTEREITLVKIGDSRGVPYVGVQHEGKFKTLRCDRIVAVLEQLTTGHSCSLRAAITYADRLPVFPLQNAMYKVATTAVSNRTWTVDLNAYTCTCPEKRIRGAKGYKPGQLGFVCDHIAKAILANLPTEHPEWSSELLAFLADPRKVHIDNLA